MKKQAPKQPQRKPGRPPKHPADRGRSVSIYMNEAEERQVRELLRKLREDKR